MIFVTVGMQLPFDRLIKAMDKLAPKLGCEIFAQIGRTDYVPSNMHWVDVLDASEFEAKVSRADVVVSHAGIGSILAAQRNSKPLVILPRRASLLEHRNDHQMATINAIQDRRGIFSIQEESELETAIENGGKFDSSKIESAQASPSLRVAIEQFINYSPEPIVAGRRFGFFSK